MARKRLTGRVDVQKLYEEGKMHTDEFYHGVTNLIKWLLMKCLIAKGHWKNGIRQTNFDQEDVDDCFTYVFGKIIEKYSPINKEAFFGQFEFCFNSSSEYTEDMLEAVAMQVYVYEGKIVKVSGYDI